MFLPTPVGKMLYITTARDSNLPQISPPALTVDISSPEQETARLLTTMRMGIVVERAYAQWSLKGWKMLKQTMIPSSL